MTREEVIERFNGIINAMSISIAQSKFYPSKAELDELCNMAIEALKDRPQGEWKHTITWQPYCSNCEYVFGEDEEFSPFWKYCPMCGARMKGGDAEVRNDRTYINEPYMQQSRHDDGRMTREEAISEWTFRSNHIKKWLDEYGEEPSIRHYVELIDMAIEALSERNAVQADDRIEQNKIYCSPLVAENVEVVVRCKDCRHWDKKDRYCTDGGGLIIGVTENDFCSRGERREP